MRLPLRRLHRAFPDLDRFDDAACQHLLTRVKEQHPDRLTLVGCLSVLIILSGVVATLLGLRWLGARLAAATGWQPTPLFYLALGIPAILAVALAALTVYDRTLGRLLKEALDHKCESCRYPLTGLPPTAGRTTCPECGRHNPEPPAP